MGKMKRRTVLTAMLLFVVWLSISLTYKPNHLVTEDEIVRYGETYLSTFRNLVNEFKSEDRVYFSQYVEFWNRTVELRPKISDSHGAGIEFVVYPAFAKLQISRCNERIEVAVFGGDFYTEYGAHGLPFKINSVRIILVLESGVEFIAGGHCMFEVLDNSTLAVVGSNWTLDGSHYQNPLTIKGSNTYESWSSDKAVWDAEFDFKYDLARAFNASESVREYVAYTELKDLLNSIVKKAEEDPSYDWRQYTSDLEELDRLAREKYGVVRSDFLEDILNFTREKTSMTKKLPLISIEYSNDFIYTLFFAVLLDASLILAIIIDRILKRIKGYSKSLARMFRMAFEWFWFLPVFIWYCQLAPFGYEWIIHVPILLLQLAILGVSFYFLQKVRFKLQLNWKSILYRMVFSVILLSILLVFVQSATCLVYSLSFMFRTYSLIIGEATTLSLLVATMAVLIILISQQLYSSFHEQLF